MDNKEKVYEFLKRLGISFVEHIHPPVYTVEEANQHWKNIEGLHCKNIFLRDKRGRQHFLVIMPSYKNVDMKKLNSLLNERLSFASPERLIKYLGLEGGSVSPFGLINDHFQHVVVILDDAVMMSDKINFHPNINTATVTLTTGDFKRYLEECGNSIVTCNI